MNNNCIRIKKEHSGISFLNQMKKDPLNFFVKFGEKNGSHVWFKMPGENVLFLNDATGIQHVLQKNYKNYWKGKYNQVLKPIFGDGIFLAEQEAWKSQKKLSAPSFSTKHFSRMTDKMIHSVNLMFERLDEKAENDQSSDLSMELMWYTIDVVLRALYYSDKDNVAHDIKNSLGQILEECEKRIWAAFSLPQSLLYKLPPYKGAINYLLDIVKEIVEDKKVSKAFPDDLLHNFINEYDNSKKNRALLYDQVLSFLLAGHETTANALFWTFYELAKRPDLKEKLRSEIDSVFKNEPVSFEKLKDLKLSRAVFAEALRLHPPVWSMSRASYAEDLIPLDDGTEIHLPANTTVMMCTYTMHKNTKYWEDPEAFTPERFLKDEQPKPLCYFPFGGGPRSCMGQRFAETESLIVLAMFLQRYDFSLLPGQIVEQIPAISLKPGGPVYFKIVKRETAQEKPTDFKLNIPETPKCPLHKAA